MVLYCGIKGHTVDEINCRLHTTPTVVCTNLHAWSYAGLDLEKKQNSCLSSGVIMLVVMIKNLQAAVLHVRHALFLVRMLVMIRNASTKMYS